MRRPPVLLLATVLALFVGGGGCLGDEYKCATDADCDMGVGGRCELDHHCTQYDGTCPLERRYTPHSGSDTGQCFAENVTPLNLCAPGQPPADSHDACAAAVCATTASCCTSGWIETCVQQAQRLCSIHCDTRIAITAEGGQVNAPQNVAVYDLRYDPGTKLWTVKQPIGRGGFLDWLAPAPGTTEPRLAGMNGPAGPPQFFIDDTTPVMAPLAPDRHYDSAATVDFDRSGHDTVMLATYDTPTGDRHTHQLIDLTTGGVRQILTSNAPVETWGDYNGDGYPDAVAASGGGASFHFNHNIPDANHARQIDDSVSAGVNGGPLPLRSFSWADLDANGRMDLVQFGSEIQFHMGNMMFPLSDNATMRLDCEPIVALPAPSCPSGVMPQQQGGYSLVGTTVPTMKGMTVVASVDNLSSSTSETRNLYNLGLKFGPLGFAGTSSIAFASPPACPAPCDAPIRAVVARDLNDDGVLDLIAIDARLGVWVGLGAMDGSYGKMMFQPVVFPPVTTPYALVRVSTTGAPR